MRLTFKQIVLFAASTLAVLTLISGVAVADKKYPFEKPPGPIAGRWSLSCAKSAGTVVEITLQDKKRASGRIVELGLAGKYGYVQEEEILRLEVDGFGDWVGQLKWRGLAGTDRWDPIRFTASATMLNATMTTDTCYRNMIRLTLQSSPRPAPPTEPATPQTPQPGPANR